MSQIVKVTEAHFEQIYPLLSNLRSPTGPIAKETWKGLFQHHWQPHSDHYGYALMEGEKAVGFLGLIRSWRKINGEDREFANITSWIVNEEARGKSIMLLAPFIRSKDLTLVCLTPSKESGGVFHKLGFTVCDRHLKFVPALPSIQLTKRYRIEFERELIEKELSLTEQKIFQDHARFSCLHFMIRSDSGNCYVIAQRAVKRGLPFLFIHYISNSELFSKAIAQFSGMLSWKMKTIGLLVYEHYMDGFDLRPSFNIGLKNPTMFRSIHAGKKDIDSLYSEFFILNFA